MNVNSRAQIASRERQTRTFGLTQRQHMVPSKWPTVDSQFVSGTPGSLHTCMRMYSAFYYIFLMKSQEKINKSEVVIISTVIVVYVPMGDDHADCVVLAILGCELIGVDRVEAVV